MPGRAQAVTPEEPTAGILHGGVREGGDPGESWCTYTGTKLETADTAKEHLPLTGPPLLGKALLTTARADSARLAPLAGQVRSSFHNG